MLNHANIVSDNINAKNEFSVTEISNNIKSLLENSYSHIRIRGEISGLKIAPSGHGYFNLKDSNSVIAATCWRQSLARIGFELTEGQEIIATGRITAYAGQSKYQISVEFIEPAGIGAFLAILNERRKKLEAEGLFRPEHKKELPFLPRKIGVVTSLAGAVIKDIIHRISDRFPVTLCIWPVLVQGQAAAGEISAAIDGFNLLEKNSRPDLLIIARGGGSIEDLWAFNEESVVRAAYNSAIPIISAVGHETDYTLLDLVADRRAPTPTAAAEFAVPELEGLKNTLKSLGDNLEQRTKFFIRHKSWALEQLGRISRYLISYLNNKVQKLDDLGFRLAGSLPNLLAQKKMNLKYFPYSRLKPEKIFRYKSLQLSNLAENLLNKKNDLLNPFEYKLSINTSILSSLDYRNALKRGYAMLKNQDNKYISTIEQVRSSGYITLQLQDGEITLDSSAETA